MTPPSTSKAKTDQEKQRRVAIFMSAVVAPILIAIAILVGLDIIPLDFSDEFELPRLDTFPDYLLAPKQIYSSTNLFELGMSLQNEIALVEDIFSKTNLKCMNVNWYGSTGNRQIFYNDSVGEIQVALKELGIVQGDEITQPPFLLFIENQLVKMYGEVHCPHVDNMLKVPDQYDPTAGVTAYYACINHPFFNDKEYCTFLPKEPLTT